MLRRPRSITPCHAVFRPAAQQLARQRVVLHESDGVAFRAGPQSRTNMAKRDLAGANKTCRQCGLTNKARDGHMPREGPFAAMRAPGWCPERQEFSVRSASSDKRGAGLRLRLLDQHVLTVDSEGAVRFDPAACTHHEPAQQQQLESEMREAVYFVEDVRAGRPREVASRLRARPELVLVPVLRQCPPLDRLGRQPGAASWSILTEAIAQDSEDCVVVLEVLLALCHALRIDINRMPVKSDSRTTALHRAADLGDRRATEVLIAAGADMFSSSRRGWLPMHVALRKEASEEAKVTVVWLLEKMFEADPFHPALQLPPALPVGFEKHRADGELLLSTLRPLHSAFAVASEAVISDLLAQ